MEKGTSTIEEKVRTDNEHPWANFPNPKHFLKPREMSYQPNWFNLSKDGGGDIDLADYSLE